MLLLLLTDGLCCPSSPRMWLCRGCCLLGQCVSCRWSLCCLTEPSPGLENNTFIFLPLHLVPLSSRGVLAPRCFQYPFLRPFPGVGLTSADLLLLSGEQRAELHLCRVLASKRSFPAVNSNHHKQAGGRLRSLMSSLYLGEKLGSVRNAGSK